MWSWEVLFCRYVISQLQGKSERYPQSRVCHSGWSEHCSAPTSFFGTQTWAPYYSPKTRLFHAVLFLSYQIWTHNWNVCQQWWGSPCTCNREASVKHLDETTAILSFLASVIHQNSWMSPRSASEDEETTVAIMACCQLAESCDKTWKLSCSEASSVWVSCPQITLHERVLPQ